MPTPPLRALRPAEQARFKADNFSYTTLAAGEATTVEVYAFEPGAGLPGHRHEATEHVLTVVAGTAGVRVGRIIAILQAGETALVPAGPYHGIFNAGLGRLVVQQVSGPNPWDARFSGPQPSELRRG